MGCSRHLLLPSFECGGLLTPWHSLPRGTLIKVDPPSLGCLNQKWRRKQSDMLGLLAFFPQGTESRTAKGPKGQRSSKLTCPRGSGALGQSTQSLAPLDRGVWGALEGLLESASALCEQPGLQSAAGAGGALRGLAPTCPWHPRGCNTHVPVTPTCLCLRRRCREGCSFVSGARQSHHNPQGVAVSQRWAGTVKSSPHPRG